jgi:hypothetical protein
MRKKNKEFKKKATCGADQSITCLDLSGLDV